MYAPSCVLNTTRLGACKCCNVKKLYTLSGSHGQFLRFHQSFLLMYYIHDKWNGMKCHLSSRRILASKLNCIQLCSFAGHCFNLRISLAKLRLKKMNCRSTDRYKKKNETSTNVSSRSCLLSFPFFPLQIQTFCQQFKYTNRMKIQTEL